jgi:hypothetical protein
MFSFARHGKSRRKEERWGYGQLPYVLDLVLGQQAIYSSRMRPDMASVKKSA